MDFIKSMLQVHIFLPQCIESDAHSNSPKHLWTRLNSSTVETLLDKKMEHTTSMIIIISETYRTGQTKSSDLVWVTTSDKSPARNWITFWRWLPGAHKDISLANGKENKMVKNQNAQSCQREVTKDWNSALSRTRETTILVIDVAMPIEEEKGRNRQFWTDHKSKCGVDQSQDHGLNWHPCVSKRD